MTGDPPATDDHRSLEFFVDAPLDLRATMGELGLPPSDPAFRLAGDHGVALATRTADGLASMHFRHAITDGVLRVDVWGDGADAVLKRASTMAGLHDDPLLFMPSNPNSWGWCVASPVCG